MSTKNYKMIAKLESGNWTAWVAKTTPDYTGVSYTGGGTLITNTIQVSGTYLDVGDYYYMMIGKLITGEWVTWGSFYSPDRLGIYYSGAGNLIQDTIQVSRFYEYTGVPPIFVNEYSLLFGGTNEYVTMGDVLNFDRTDAFSVSCWFKSTSSTYQYFVSKFNATPVGWGFRINSDGTLDWLFHDTDSSSAMYIRTNSSRFLSGMWFNVIATFDGSGVISGMTIYVNGAVEPTSIYINTLHTSISNNGPLNIGARTNGVASPFTGNIDEVSVYNKELSLSEVQTIYNNGIPTDLTGSTNLVGYWRMGDGVGFNGTMTNMEAEDIVADVP